MFFAVLKRMALHFCCAFFDYIYLNRGILRKMTSCKTTSCEIFKKSCLRVYISIILALTVFCMSGLSGCKKTDKTQEISSAKSIVSWVLATGEYSSPSLVFGLGDEEFSLRFSSMYHSDPSIISDGAFAIAEGIASDELSVLTASGSTKNDDLEKMFEERINEQIACYESYSPGDVAKLKKAECFTKGVFTVLIVSDDPSGMKSLVTEFIDNPQKFPVTSEESSEGVSPDEMSSENVSIAEATSKETSVTSPIESASVQPMPSEQPESKTEIAHGPESSQTPYEAYPDGNRPASEPYFYAYDCDLPEKQPVSDDYFSDAVFIGSSRLDGILAYGGEPACAGRFAYTSLNVSSVFTRNVVDSEDGTKTIAEALKNVSFSKCYIEFGINEVGWPYPSVFEKDYKKLIDYIRELNPECTIYILNLYPVTPSHSAKDEYETNRNVKIFNDIIASVVRDKGVYQVNLAAAVCDENCELPEEDSYDGVHVNVKTSVRLMDYIKSHTA